MNEVSITINGTRYELMPEDDTFDICTKCDLTEYCDKIEETTLCAIFGNTHFEVFKAVKDNVKDNVKDKGYINVQVEFNDGTSRYYKTKQRDILGVLELIVDKDYLALDNIDGLAEIINISNIKTIREAKFV